MLRVLFLGDIVGEPGRSAVIAKLPELKARDGIDFTIDLLRAGVSVVTTGDHIWDQKDVMAFLELEPRLLRPINYPSGAPGHGSIVLETAESKCGVLNLQARTVQHAILENT